MRELVLILLFVSCNQEFNYNQYKPVKDTTMVKGKWYGDRFWFKTLENKKYEFMDGSHIIIEDDYIIQNGEKMGKFKFDLEVSSIVMEKDTIPKTFNIKINDKKNKILLSYFKNNMEMVRLYFKK